MTAARKIKILNKLKLQEILHNVKYPSCYNCGARNPAMSPFEGSKGYMHGRKCCKRKYEIIWVKKMYPVCFHWNFKRSVI